jgi:lysophospholipase L1-like esterase
MRYHHFILRLFLVLTTTILAACGGGGGGAASSIQLTTGLAKQTGQTYCVIGDSFSSDPSKYSPTPWPVTFQQQTGNTVIDAAVGGFTFYDALMKPVINGQTPVQYCISQNPSAVLVMLGINDTAPGSQYAPLGTIESNAAAVYSQLKQGLPNAKIVYILEQMYDLADYPNPHTMPNKAAVVWYTIYNQQNQAPDPNAIINSWAQDVFTNLMALNEYIKTMGPAVVTVNYWQIQQQTGVSPDGLHPLPASSVMMESVVQSQL